MSKTISLLLFILMIGCGIRGKPSPPKLNKIPNPKMKIFQQGENIILKIKLHNKFENGEEIRYKKIKVSLKWKGGEKTIFKSRKIPTEIEKEVWDELLNKKVKAVFEIKAYGARTSKFSSKFIDIMVTPVEPKSLKAESKEDGIHLQWKKPEKNWDGSPAKPIGYLVFRDGKLITKHPVIITSYIDGNVKNGKEYSYTVSALLSLKPPYSMGKLSGEVGIKYIDKFPPSPPGNIDIISSGKDIYLSWSKSSSSDTKGYFLWRNGKKITKKPIKETSFWDKGLKNGKYIYWVTAVDKSGNQSSASPKKDVEIK